jgi:hypothetical protein
MWLLNEVWRGNVRGRGVLSKGWVRVGAILSTGVCLWVRGGAAGYRGDRDQTQERQPTPAKRMSLPALDTVSREIPRDESVDIQPGCQQAGCRVGGSGEERVCERVTASGPS